MKASGLVSVFFGAAALAGVAAAPAFGDGSDKVTARAAGPVPGALVCPHIKTTEKVYGVFVSNAAHGASAPDPAQYGCHLVPAGQTMTLGQGMAIVIVTIRLPDGTEFRGATLPSMVRY